ncbi:MAG: glycosyltransferase family 9 protein [Planctomycetota bacterium]
MGRPKLADADPRSICVLKPSALGDVVQSLPLLAPLKRRFPAASIAWVIRDDLAGAVRGNPRIDHVIEFRRRSGVAAWPTLLNTLQEADFDVVLDLQGLLRTAVMGAVAAAPVRVGLETAREGSRLACTEILPGTGRDVPAWDRYLRVADHLGVPRALPGDGPALAPTAAAVNEARALLAGLPRPLLAVAPGAVWATKKWPPEHFAGVLAKARRKLGAGAVILGAEGDAEIGRRMTTMLGRMTPAARAFRDLTGRTSLPVLAAMLAECDLALTNDSGPLHIAAAVGTPSVSVFTCTDPARSGPPPGPHASVSTGLSCAASYKKTCPFRGEKHMACHDEIAAARVFAVVADMLESRDDVVRRAA